MAFCFFVYNWKAGGALTKLFKEGELFPFNVPEWMQGLSAQAADLSTLLGILTFNLGKPGFWYSVLYTLLVVVFGYRRIVRRRTPYVKWQTFSLGAVQIAPLFLLPISSSPIWATTDFSIRVGPRPSPMDSSRWSITTTGANTGGLLGWFWLGRSLCGTSSAASRCGGGWSSARCRRLWPSHCSSTSGAREPIAAGSVPAAHSPRPWATRSGTRCRTGPSGTR